MNQIKKYAVKKIFGPTIQGEGSMTGIVTHFVRFSGCNMWDGRPETKAKSQCPYCDTDFFGGERLSATQIVRELKALPKASWVTLSGGEPALQMDLELIRKIQEAGFKIAVETNGTIDFSSFAAAIDHITCSPKQPLEKTKLKYCDTLKLLYPHPFLKPEDFINFNAENHYLQPIEDKDYTLNLMDVIKYLKDHPKWRLSLQTHKIIGVE